MGIEKNDIVKLTIANIEKHMGKSNELWIIHIFDSKKNIKAL